MPPIIDANTNEWLKEPIHEFLSVFTSKINTANLYISLGVSD